MLDLVTLIIPTKNRHYYLARILEYYSNSGLKIIIADASTNRYNKKIPSNSTYYHYPDIPYCDKLDDVFKKVNTPYSLFCADDDFILIDAITKCVSFLKANKSYSSAQGNYVFYNYSQKQFFYTPAYTGAIGADLNDESPSKRISTYNKTPIQLYYCVHRTETLKYVFSNASKKIKNLNLVELLIGYCSVIFGKHKVLPIFYSQRELLYDSAGKSDRIDVISTSVKYKQEYGSFIKIVDNLLSKHESNTKVNMVNDAIKELIIHRLSNQFTSKAETVGKLAKIIIPLWLRKSLRHYALVLSKSTREKKNRLFAVQNKGFPFNDGTDYEEMKRIESLILKHNIVQI